MTTQSSLEDISTKENMALQVEDTKIQNQEDIEPSFSLEETLISIHALQGISTPQTMKLIDFVKKYKFIFIVTNRSTRNFVHERVVEETHCVVNLVHNFQIMITNGGMVKCGGRCENVNLQMAYYELKTLFDKSFWSNHVCYS